MEIPATEQTLTENNTTPTGSTIFDSFLGGGFEKGHITAIYGPGGSGKTTTCMLAMTRMAGSGKKIIYIDTESGFSVERMQQITRHAEKALQRTIFFRPLSFTEQDKIFSHVKALAMANVGLIIVDTISAHYRIEVSRTEDNYRYINTLLARQVSMLAGIARTCNIPVLITSQVYADFNEKDKVKLVGGDILRDRSSCIIELQSLKNNNRCAVLRKHRSIPERVVEFSITEKGFKGKR